MKTLETSSAWDSHPNNQRHKEVQVAKAIRRCRSTLRNHHRSKTLIRLNSEICPQNEQCLCLNCTIVCSQTTCRTKTETSSQTELPLLISLTTKDELKQQKQETRVICSRIALQATSNKRSNQSEACTTYLNQTNRGRALLVFPLKLTSKDMPQLRRQRYCQRLLLNKTLTWTGKTLKATT
jgi:hypothetical protein